MSEYIEIAAEIGDHGELLFETNLPLTADGCEESYGSQLEMEAGSTVAQVLAAIEGIHEMRLAGGTLVVVIQPGVDWHTVIADVTAALKDFFL